MPTSTQWQLAREAAERYESVLVPAILGPAAQALVERCALAHGDTVVDVGCGTGAAARFAAARVGSSGRVVGIDVNAGMINVARSLPPVEGAPIEWHEKSAHDLPLPDASVDASLCAQTLQFLNDPPRALAEMYRVLKPGGRIALSLWCDIRQNPYFHSLVESVARHIGRETAAGLGSAFTLSDPDRIRALLEKSGFSSPEMTVEQLDLQLPRLQDFVPRHVSATPMAAGFEGAPEAARQAVVNEVSKELAHYATGVAVRLPFRTHLVTARR